ncbi:LysR family transcriptional regulator [Paracraurococcus lichenis]|uniref:LysR family transcriptional regulator n=1 Tax=Paracraurococcus lichenis TaxID=3064888 RepID=A0ABT9DVF8_9PROT|nr:LysR family transcriptional regulator [Paracraurococcus sp. LOR1-02]MDO9707887.1 LysR family transcriptional regulator [Paracraurococcus sp. LOR1-02]
MLSNPPFDLLDLRLVQRVAQAGSLSAAAGTLGLTPAAASRRLAVLEERIGVRLFARTTRRLRPTPEGEAFLPQADRVLAAAAEAEAALPGGTAALAGTLRLTAPATFGRKILAPILAELLAAHPALRLDLLLTDSLLDLVATGCDAAVRIAPLSGQTLVARRLADNRRVLCAAPDYLARRGVPARREDLARHDTLVLQGVDAWMLVPEGGGPAQRARLAPRVTGNSNEALREACLAGLGIGLHSTWDIGGHLRRGELVALPPALGQPEQLGIWLVLPGSAVAPARVRALTELLVRRLGPVPPWEG